MKIDYTDQEKNAVLLYQGCGVPGDSDVFYQQSDAFQSFNLFLMEGQDGERVRICIEKQQPKCIYIRRWTKTLEVMEDLFRVQCKYACQQVSAGKSLPNPLVRDDRKVNVVQMLEAGRTVAFTSTSKDTMREGFLGKKQDPHVLHITLSEQVPYLDFEGFWGSAYSYEEEREVLLPPMVEIDCQSSWITYEHGISKIQHYNITFKGFCDDTEMMDEKELIAFLAGNAEAAADGLLDIVSNKLASTVLTDKNHIYWQWKIVFRKLAIQRMITIYRSYFA